MTPNSHLAILWAMLARDTGISVVIPCLNEAFTIERVIENCIRSVKTIHVPFEILVADNGSTDNSAAKARFAGARIISVPRRGYGNTLRQALGDARYNAIVYLDADLSYPAEFIPQFYEKLKSADLVLGSRLNGKIHPRSMRWTHRFIGTPLLSWLVSFIGKQKVTDCNSGMRAIRKSTYNQLNCHAEGMEFASELIIEAFKHRIRYQEIPIPFFPDGRIGRSHLSPINDGFRHLKVIGFGGRHR